MGRFTGPKKKARVVTVGRETEGRGKREWRERLLTVYILLQ